MKRQTVAQRRRRGHKSQAGYVPPSRSYRKPRDEYLAEVRVSREQKLANHRARQARYRERKRSGQ